MMLHTSPELPSSCHKNGSITLQVQSKEVTNELMEIHTHLQPLGAQQNTRGVTTADIKDGPIQLLKTKSTH